jgi:hypothetical protein
MRGHINLFPFLALLAILAIPISVAIRRQLEWYRIVRTPLTPKEVLQSYRPSPPAEMARARLTTLGRTAAIAGALFAPFSTLATIAVLHKVGIEHHLLQSCARPYLPVAPLPIVALVLCILNAPIALICWALWRSHRLVINGWTATAIVVGTRRFGRYSTQIYYDFLDISGEVRRGRSAIQDVPQIVFGVANRVHVLFLSHRPSRNDIRGYLAWEEIPP